MMHGHEKSDSAIVAVKPTNKAEHSAASPRIAMRGSRLRRSQIALKAGANTGNGIEPSPAVVYRLIPSNVLDHRIGAPLAGATELQPGPARGAGVTQSTMRSVSTVRRQSIIAWATSCFSRRR
jgi:hypothetical protein